MERFNRSALLLGDNYLEKLQNKKILIFGLGGVGSYVVETLARTGITNFVLVDSDVVSLSNINRQIIATTSTLSQLKTIVSKQRILDINPHAKVDIFTEFVLPENLKTVYFENVDYCIDCIDTVSAKIAIIKYCDEHKIPIISAMGTGNKLDPTKFKIADIFKTTMCPLAKVMRYELRKRGIKKLDVLFSEEPVIELKENLLHQQLLKQENITKHAIPGSVAFCPSIAGIMIARHVILKLLEEK